MLITGQTPGPQHGQMLDRLLVDGHLYAQDLFGQDLLVPMQIHQRRGRAKVFVQKAI